MATVTSGAMIAGRFTPPATPEGTSLKIKEQASETPTPTRRSRRATKPTERGADFKLPSAKKVGNAAFTPSPSPPRVTTLIELFTEKGAYSDVDGGKSDPDSNASPCPDKIMLRFPPAIVLKVFRSSSSKAISHPYSSPEAVGPATSAPTPKKGTRATSKVEKKTGKKPTSKTAQRPSSMIEPGLTAVSQSALSSIKLTGEDRAEGSTAKAGSAANYTSKPAPTPNILKEKAAKNSAPNTKQASVLMAPANNEVAKEVPKPAPVPMKRGYGTAQLITEDEAAGRPTKFQRLSAPGNRGAVAPEPIIGCAQRTPDETDCNAWLFAYGKEGTETYLREKFPECEIEAYGYGRLENYKFVLHSDCYAKAIAKPGSEIYGALWKIPEKIRSALEKKAAKHGMKYRLVSNIQPMHTDPAYVNPWDAPFIPHAEPLKCWMGVCERLNGRESLGKFIARDNFFKRRGLSNLIMEMEMSGVPQEYFDKYTRMWIPPPRDTLDTGYHVDRKMVKPSKK